MWTEADIARSLAWYLSLTLDGPPWRIRTERREVSDDQRPVAVVDLGDGSPTRAREGTLWQGEIESVFPVTISAYPAKAAKEKDGRIVAETLRSLLRGLIEFGITVQDHQKQHYSGPFRIPLWNWDGVPTSGPEKGMDGDPHDVLWVPRESLTTRVLQDLEDWRRYTVVCEFRVTMEQPGRDSPEAAAPPVTGISGSGSFPP